MSSVQRAELRLDCLLGLQGAFLVFLCSFAVSNLLLQTQMDFSPFALKVSEKQMDGK